MAFAQEQLAPKGEANPEFLEGLEETLALLAFADPADAAASPIGVKLGLGNDCQRRRETASELNAAVLSSEAGLAVDKVDPKVTEPALHLLFKELLWRQKRLTEKGLDFPRVPEDNMLHSTTLEYAGRDTDSGGIARGTAFGPQS